MYGLVRKYWYRHQCVYSAKTFASKKNPTHTKISSSEYQIVSKRVSADSKDMPLSADTRLYRAIQKHATYSCNDNRNLWRHLGSQIYNTSSAFLSATPNGVRRWQLRMLLFFFVQFQTCTETISSFIVLNGSVRPIKSLNIHFCKEPIPMIVHTITTKVVDFINVLFVP